MTNPLEDESRWTVMGSRFEMPKFLKDEIDRMMEEFIESLPVDHPARLLYYMLPKSPFGWDND